MSEDNSFREHLVTFRAIGFVRNAFARPVSPDVLRGAESQIIIDEALSEGLTGLEPGCQIMVIFCFHQAPRDYALLQHPRGDAGQPQRGVFALRSPHRPNPIGVTTVDLLRIEGNVLHVRGLDALDNTPILDIKPAYQHTCKENTLMKIAAITDDGHTISQHFGRAQYYAVYVVEDGAVVNREMRSKAGHHDFVHEQDHEHEGQQDPRGHGFGHGAASRHARMIGAITDCDVILVRGMGRGAYMAMEEAGIKPVVTDIEIIEEAVKAYLDGSIVDHTDWLH